MIMECGKHEMYINLRLAGLQDFAKVKHNNTKAMKMTKKNNNGTGQ